MTEPISVNLTGAGSHILIPGVARTWIEVARVLLTVKLPSNGAMGITGKSGSDVRLGPFYMQNGGTLSFARETIPLMVVDVGDDLIIELDSDGTLGGTIIIERGQV